MTSPAIIRAVPHERLVELTHVPVESSVIPPTECSGEGPAWFQLVLGQYEGPLLRYAQRITGDVDSARDVVQETFLQLLKEDREKLNGYLTRWLFHVCRNRALDAHRKEQRMSVATDMDLQTLPGRAEPMERLSHEETNSRLLNLLDGLPANQQEVIRLKFQNELKYREIAEITGLSVSHVGVLLHAGLKRLRELMKHDE